MTWIIPLAVCWILLLATLWIAFVIFCRWRTLSFREKVRTKVLTTGSQADGDDRGISDSREAFLEEVAILRAKKDHEARRQ